MADAPRVTASLAQPQSAEPAQSEEVEPAFVEHQVTSRDTLQGLALRYGVNTSEIKLANDLATDNLSVVKVLRIPKGKRILPAPQQIQVDPNVARLREFRVKNKLSEHEARYYMESAEYDLGRAQREFERDGNFAKNNAASEQRMLQEIASGTLASKASTHGAPIGTTVANVLRQGRDLVQSMLPSMPATVESSPLLGGPDSHGHEAGVDHHQRDRAGRDRHDDGNSTSTARATASGTSDRAGIELRHRRVAVE